MCLTVEYSTLHVVLKISVIDVDCCVCANAGGLPHPKGMVTEPLPEVD